MRAHIGFQPYLAVDRCLSCSREGWFKFLLVLNPLKYERFVIPLIWADDHGMTGKFGMPQKILYFFKA